MDTYSFLLIVESILMYGIIVIGVYFGLMPKNIFYAALSVIIAIKSLLLYKAHQIFFPEIHGSLHLFVYFCTLELVPLLAIARILMWITDLLIVNYWDKLWLRKFSFHSLGLLQKDHRILILNATIMSKLYFVPSSRLKVFRRKNSGSREFPFWNTPLLFSPVAML